MPRLYRFDFDQTIMLGHVHQKLYTKENLQQSGESDLAYKERIRNKMRGLLDNPAEPDMKIQNKEALAKTFKAIIDNGDKISIESYSKFPDAMDVALVDIFKESPPFSGNEADARELMNKHVKVIHDYPESPGFQNNAALDDKIKPGELPESYKARIGKELHTQKAKQQFEKEGVVFDKPSVLIDDDDKNIKKARERGAVGIHAPLKSNMGALDKVQKMVKTVTAGLKTPPPKDIAAVTPAKPPVDQVPTTQQTPVANISPTTQKVEKEMVDDIQVRAKRLLDLYDPSVSGMKVSEMSEVQKGYKAMLETLFRQGSNVMNRETEVMSEFALKERHDKLSLALSEVEKTFGLVTKAPSPVAVAPAPKPPAAIPLADQVMNINALYTNEPFQKDVLNFAIKEFSTENVEFLLGLRRLKNEKDETLLKAGLQTLYETYVPSNADKQINLPANMVKALAEAAANKNLTLSDFEIAKNEVEKLFARDTLARFKKTPGALANLDKYKNAPLKEPDVQEPKAAAVSPVVTEPVAKASLAKSAPLSKQALEEEGMPGAEAAFTTMMSAPVVKAVEPEKKIPKFKSLREKISSQFKALKKSLTDVYKNVLDACQVFKDTAELRGVIDVQLAKGNENKNCVAIRFEKNPNLTEETVKSNIANIVAMAVVAAEKAEDLGRPMTFKIRGFREDIRNDLKNALLEKGVKVDLDDFYKQAIESATAGGQLDKVARLEHAKATDQAFQEQFKVEPRIAEPVSKTALRESTAAKTPLISTVTATTAAPQTTPAEAVKPTNRSQHP